MRNSIKKPYLNLNGLPLLGYALKTFDKCSYIDAMYLALSRSDMGSYYESIVVPLNLSQKVNIVAGGTTRQDSVRNVLENMKNRDKSKESVVLIHDAARPFVTEKLISRCINGVEKTGACIPIVPINDSLKEINNNKRTVSSIERNNIWIAQTPQAFNYDLILKAHHKAQKENFEGTDDSSVAENADIHVNVVKGCTYNIKVTRKTDLILAEAIATNIFNNL